MLHIDYCAVEGSRELYTSYGAAVDTAYPQNALTVKSKESGVSNSLLCLLRAPNANSILRR